MFLNANEQRDGLFTFNNEIVQPNSNQHFSLLNPRTLPPNNLFAIKTTTCFSSPPKNFNNTHIIDHAKEITYYKMPLNFFKRGSSRAGEHPAPLETADPDRLMVLDIVELYLDPTLLPYPPVVFRTIQAEDRSEFTIQLPKPIKPGIDARKLYVKLRKDTFGQTVAYMSMPEPPSSTYTLPLPDRLYNWPKKLTSAYRRGPITIVVEDSVEGRWLSMAMHVSFGGDYGGWRMKKCMQEQGEKVTDTGPRPDGTFAAGCKGLWSQ